MGVGRFFCVALPFALTLASLICLLIATLAGVTNRDLYLFRVNTTDLSISPSAVTSLLNSIGARDVPSLEARQPAEWDDSIKLDARQIGGSAAKTSNITAADIGIADLYDISLWGYCYTEASGQRTCTRPLFNWAEGGLNTTLYSTLAQGAGITVRLPDEVNNSLRLFATVTKWTEVVFIVALISLAVELFFGIFATCSRALSCITFIIAGVTSLAVIGAASLSTAMAVVVVGAVEGAAREYGVRAGFNRSFLALVWLAVAFALGAGFFWLFTICCCAPSSGSRKNRHLDATGEKYVPPSAYQPLHDDQYASHGAQYAPYYAAAPQYGKPRQGPRSDLAYEPYSHA